MKTSCLPLGPEILETRIAPATIYALDTANNILTFDSTAPETISQTRAITGLVEGDSLIGIDIRPSTGEFYSLSSNTARLYTIDPNTGVATPGLVLAADPADESNPFLGFTGGQFGIDFNPVADLLRVISRSDQNVRINVDTGLVMTDSDLTPTEARVTGAGYANSFAGAGSTVLFGIDADADTLVTLIPPNAGAVNTVGPLGVDTTEVVGFDIFTTGSTNTGFAALKQAVPNSALYSIDLNTGAATLIGDIGGAGVGDIRGITVAPQQQAIVIDGRKASFKDTDGDMVTVLSSQGEFEIGDFGLIESGEGFQLRTLKLNDDGTEFQNATISITAKRPVSGAASFVNVGYINATGVDLANVRVAGDLGQIDAGDATTATPALGILTVGSIGLLGASTQGSNSNNESAFVGGVRKIIVKSSITESNITISGGADGDLRKLQVGGSLEDVDVTVSGSIGSIDPGTAGAYKLSGGVVVAGSATAARFDVGDVLSKVKIGGDFDDSRIRVEGVAAPVTNRAATALGGVIVAGSLSSTNLLVGTLENNADVRAGLVAVGGNWVASDFAVGVDEGADNIYGTADDVPLATNTSGIVSRIAGIKIAGQVIGTLDSTTDGFGFVAEEIARFKAGGSKLGLTPDKDNFQVGSTGDVRVREVSAAT